MRYYVDQRHFAPIREAQAGQKYAESLSQIFNGRLASESAVIEKGAADSLTRQHLVGDAERACE